MVDSDVVIWDVSRQLRMIPMEKSEMGQDGYG